MDIKELKAQLASLIESATIINNEIKNKKMLIRKHEHVLYIKKLFNKHVALRYTKIMDETHIVDHMHTHDDFMNIEYVHDGVIIVIREVLDLSDGQLLKKANIVVGENEIFNYLGI